MFVADPREVPCLLRPCSHPGHIRPFFFYPRPVFRGRPGSGPGRRRARARADPAALPDPDAIRLSLFPTSAPPYDDELLPPSAARRTTGPAPRQKKKCRPSGGPGRPTGPAAEQDRAGTSRAGEQAPATGRDQPGEPDQRGGQFHPRAGITPPGPSGDPWCWPGQFAQVLVETLAGSRPPRQMSSWATDRTRARIQRLGPMLTAGQRPRLRRVVAFRPASGVIEMTVVVSFDPGSGPWPFAWNTPAAPGPARSSAPQPPLAVHRGRGRLSGPPGPGADPGPGGTGGAVAGPDTAVRASHRGQLLSSRRGCGGRRGSACTCGLTRRGTGRCGRPG